jgi:hypothetical protein
MRVSDGRNEEMINNRKVAKGVNDGEEKRAENSNDLRMEDASNIELFLFQFEHL